MKLVKACKYLGEKTSIPGKFPTTSQFVTGMSGALRAQFFKPCKYTEQHQFNCHMRRYLDDIIKPFRQSRCPITKSIANMIYGNNVYQDLLGHELKKESVKGFFFQLKRIENLLQKAYECETNRAEEIAQTLSETHEYLAHAFKKDGQEAGYYLHKIGKYQESTKHYLLEILKLPPIIDINLEGIVLPKADEEKENKKFDLD